MTVRREKNKQDLEVVRRGSDDDDDKHVRLPLLATENTEPCGIPTEEAMRLLKDWSTPSLHELNKDVFASYAPETVANTMSLAAKRVQDKHLKDTRAAFIRGKIPVHQSYYAELDTTSSPSVGQLPSSSELLSFKRSQFVGMVSGCIIVLIYWAWLASLITDFFGIRGLALFATGSAYAAVKIYRACGRPTEDELRPSHLRDSALMSREKLLNLVNGNTNANSSDTTIV